MTSWSVFAMVAEERPVLDRWVAHYLSMGADYVHLFFDRDEDPAFDHFDGQPGVVAVRAGRDHWRRMLRRPPRFQERRQILNGALAYEACRSDWQVHVDADELILGGPGLGRQLGALGPEITHINLRVIEPLDVTGEAELRQFRRAGTQYGRRVMEKVYGAAAPILKKGMLGHANGKSILRAGLVGWRHGIHLPRIPAHAARKSGSLVDYPLAHMHCESRTIWVERSLARIASPGYNMATGGSNLAIHIRETLPEHFGDAPDRIVLEGFYDMVNCPDASRLAMLRKYDLLEQHRLDMWDSEEKSPGPKRMKVGAD